jgi:hypothetical protein
MKLATGSWAGTILTYVGPLLAVLVGWILHELSDVIRLGRQDRRAAGQVLAELLELRHLYRCLPAVIQEIHRRTPVPPEADALLRTMFSTLLSPMLSSMQKSYKEAVDSIAGRLPLLAFELRGKELVKPVLDQLRSFAAPDPDAAAALSAVEATLDKETLPLLDELALKLARIHGYGTWLRLRRRLKKPGDLTTEVQKLFDSLIKAAGLPPPQSSH